MTATATKPHPFERERPHDIDAETGVLGSLLLNGSAADDVMLVVQPEDFFSYEHRIVFEHMLAIHGSGKHIDITLLSARLKKFKQYEAVGGSEFLLKLAQSQPTAANARWYAETVQEKAIARGLLATAESITADVFDKATEPQEALSRAESKLFAVGERSCGESAKPISSVMLAAIDAVDRRANGGIACESVPSGYHDLDRLIVGFDPGQLVILAGRPHMGKTALATCIIENVAATGKSVLFVSLEMTSSELGERLLAQRSSVPLHCLRQNTLSPTQRQKLTKGSNELGQMNITIDDSPSRTISQIAAVCRRQKRRNGLDLVVVDYLTMVEPDNNRDPRQEQVAKLSRRMKTMARELKVPVLCLAQLNREVEKGVDPVPRLSHLRDSGAIEQEADIVLMVHRPEYFAKDDRSKGPLKGKAELYVRKARNAKCGTVPLLFFEDYGRFESVARSETHVERYDFGNDESFT